MNIPYCLFKSLDFVHINKILTNEEKRLHQNYQASCKTTKHRLSCTIWVKTGNELLNYKHVVNNIDFNDLEIFRFIEDKHLAKQISRMQNF